MYLHFLYSLLLVHAVHCRWLDNRMYLDLDHEVVPLDYPPVSNEIFGQVIEPETADDFHDIWNDQDDFGNDLEDIPLGIPEEDKNVPGEPLTPQDFANAEKIELLAPPMDENSPDPIQFAGLFEGDISGVNASDITYEGKNAIKNLQQRWRGGIIPYVISSSFTMYERSVIAAAFKDYHADTCIRFVPRTRQGDYVNILKGAGCSSNVGRSGQGQQISLGPGCVYKGVIIHELMHAVGFWHEQSRPDRDDYVRVLWQNILRGMEFNFHKYDWSMLQTLNTPYDTSSVMHYTMYSFSRDGRSPTIVPKKAGVDFIGQRVGFSKNDLLKINRLYECTDDVITVKPTKPIKPDDKCVDNHKNCYYWSKIGECSKNPSWMLVNCKKSCQQCAKECNNSNKDCEYWARIGECKKNPGYMTIYCARSCKTCKNTQSTDEGKCIDRNEYCEAWSKDNQCRANPNYMLKYCKKSCKQC